MKILRLFKPRWWLLYSVALTAISFYVVMGLWGEPSADDDTIIYTQVILRSMGIGFALFLVILLATTSWLYYSKQHDLDRSAGLFGLLLLPILITSFLATPSIGDQRLFHVLSARFQGHVYHLAEYQARFWLVLYECDGVGIVCHPVYRGSTLILALECLDRCPDPLQLITDDKGLSLIVYGETVFTQSP
jgi:hypothetical protein